MTEYPAPLSTSPASDMPRVRGPTEAAIPIEQALGEHEGLIHAVIRRYDSGGLSYEEALQAGRIGLWRALVGYDPAQGVAFSTYAWVVIRRQIQRTIRQEAGACGGPVELGLPYPVPVELADPSADVVAIVERGLLRDTLRALLRQLPVRQRWVIVARYGLDGRSPRTRPQLGVQLACSKEWIRQLELAALAWLRQPAHSAALRQWVDKNTTADYRRALALNAAWRRGRKGRRR